VKPPERQPKIPLRPSKGEEAPLRAATLLEDRRRNQRAMLRMPVLLHVSGKQESLKAMTVAVSEIGAMLVVADSLPEGTRLVVENPRSQKRLGATVTRVPQKTPEGFMLPVEFAERAPAFWDVIFPSPGA
jgi:hypothetical protein